jgi:uncharacterized damage-inducible protein DinB
MGFYGGKELANAFRTVRNNTIQVAEDIPEQQYSHVPAPDCRSVWRMLVHIALTTDMVLEIHDRRKVTSFVGFNFIPMMETMKADEAKPRTKPQILEMLRKQHDEFGAWLEKLTPEFLSETVTMGDANTKSRFEMIAGAKEHEMHHRAQLMLIERQLGIVPHLTRQFHERLAKMQAQAQTVAKA